MKSDPDFRLLFESSTELLVVLDRDLKIIAATDAYLRATLTERNQITGQYIFDVFPENPLSVNASGQVNLHASLEAVLKNKETSRMGIQRYDIRHPHNGRGSYEERFWKTENIPLLEQNGEIKYILCKFEDVTTLVKSQQIDEHLEASNVQLKREIEERKNAENELKRNEQKLRAIIDNLPVGVWLLDKSGKILYGNIAALKIWGEDKFSDARNFFEYKAWKLDTGDAVEADQWAAVRALRSGVPVLNEELKIRQFTGAYRIILNSAIPMEDDKGNFLGLLVLNEDITERKNAEQALQESENRLRSVFDNSMDAILLTAPNGQIMMMNRAGTKLFGYTEKELQKLGRDAVIDNSDPRLIHALEQRKRTGRFRGELMLKRKDSSVFPAELSSAIFTDNYGKKWTSMFVRDITDYKSAQEEKETLLKKLEEEKIWLEAILERAPLGIFVVQGKAGEKVKPNVVAKKIIW